MSSEVSRAEYTGIDRERVAVAERNVKFQGLGIVSPSNLVNGTGTLDPAETPQTASYESVFGPRTCPGGDPRGSGHGRVSTRDFSGLLFDSKLLTGRG